MAKQELAKRLYDIINNIDCYEMRNNDYTIETAADDIIKNPAAVISYLVDIIEDLTD